MSEAKEMLEQDRQALQAMIADREALMSPAWEHIKTMILYRLELLRNRIEESDDDGPAIIRTKGRVQECRTLLNMLADVEQGIDSTSEEIKELENHCKEEEAASVAEAEGEF